MMTTWRDIATENEQAAKELLRAGRYRSAVSRAYYSAYAMVTHRLVSSGAVPKRDTQNPSHRALPMMVEGNLAGLSDWHRRDLKSATRRLYEARLDADYRPGVVVDRAVAVRSLSELAITVGLIGEEKP